MTTTETVKVCIAGYPDRTYEAVRIAGYWNGWAVPVVTAETLTAMLRDLDTDEAGNAPQYRTAWCQRLTDGAFMVEGPDDDEPSIITPDTDGLYTMDLGWVWDDVTDN